MIADLIPVDSQALTSQIVRESGRLDGSLLALLAVYRRVRFYKIDQARGIIPFLLEQHTAVQETQDPDEARRVGYEEVKKVMQGEAHFDTYWPDLGETTEEIARRLIVSGKLVTVQEQVEEDLPQAA